MKDVKARVWWTHRESDSSGFDHLKLGDPLVHSDPCQEFGEFELAIGIKDMDGNEIYEGDIVMVGTVYGLADDDDGESWMDTSFHVVRWEGERGYPAFDLDPSLDTEYNGLAHILFGDTAIRIVGNIHENPELLEKAHG